MSQAEQPQTIAQIIRTRWKKLALADQTDADEMVAALKEVLEELERLEAQGSSSACEQQAPIRLTTGRGFFRSI